VDAYPIGVFVVKPGVGITACQAWGRPGGGDIVIEGLSNGLNVETIIANLLDGDGDTKIRQYGVALLYTTPRTGAYTGEWCRDWKGHILGPNYAVQGNCLSGEHILKNMESAFINTSGSLANRLMQALLAAKESGADNRCAIMNISSMCAGILVVKPTDTNNPHLSIEVRYSPAKGDPIDDLKKKFDEWASSQTVVENKNNIERTFKLFQNFPNPFNPSTMISYQIPQTGFVNIEIFNMMGQRVRTLVDDVKNSGYYDVNWDGRNDHGEIVENGIYVYQMQCEGFIQRKKMTFLK
ncbi:hypothetical protein BVY01_00635, partial [bacterium I07]